VAQALQEAGIAPVRWIGTSLGSVTAAGLASGESPDELLRRFAAFKESEVLVRERAVLIRGVWSPALIKSAPFRAALEKLLPARKFADLVTPCTVTAVERETGQEVRFGDGGEAAPLITALCASCALPPYFRPVMVNGREFYDGGLRGPMPLAAAAEITRHDGLDMVIAVNVGPGFDEVGPPLQVPPPLVAATDTAMGWLMAGTTQLLRERWERTPGLPPLLWLRPVSDRGATFAMERMPEYARAGHRAMRTALEQLG
jgi:predicted acylesterase/phospholipase RssA